MTTTGGLPSRLGLWGRWLGPIAGLLVWGVGSLISGSSSAALLVAAVATTMAILWMSEALPLAATALIPLAAFPLLGLSNSKQVASAYAAPAIFLFLGGFLLARVVEDSGLHQRLAMSIIARVGQRPKRLVLGFLLTAASMSMWISNTATSLVLLPVVIAVTGPLRQKTKSGAKLSASLLLSVAYGASIGGVATPVGSPPNLIFIAQLQASFPQLNISFARWMLFGLPFVALFLPFAWWWLSRGLDDQEPDDAQRENFASTRAELGAMGRDEKFAAALLVSAALLWITRAPISIGALHFSGWASLFGGSSLVHDSVVAIAVALVAFALPSAQRPGQRLLTWDSAQRISWGVLLLFGGGIALAQGFQSSGLSAQLGMAFSKLQGAPITLVVLLISTAVIFLTELTSNTATTTVMMPVLAAMAMAMAVSPLSVMLPAAVAASCAFMLPVATPPNAVVFSSGLVSLREMMRAGLFLNLVGILIISLLTLAIGPLLVS